MDNINISKKKDKEIDKNYQRLYRKYKKKYLNLKKLGGSTVYKKTNLFIFISNTYRTTYKLPTLEGVKNDRRNILEALFGYYNSSLYTEIFNQPNGYCLKNIDSKLDAIFLFNSDKSILIENLNKITDNYESIMLCLSGHGENSTGIINFYSNNSKPINLSEIITKIDHEELKRVYIFIDTCRSGNSEKDESINIERLLESSSKKEIILLTARPRNMEVNDEGILITPLSQVIKNDLENFKKSFDFNCNRFKFILKVCHERIKILFDDEQLNNWLKHNFFEDIYSIEEYKETCKKLPNIYLNNKARLNLKNSFTDLNKKFNYLYKMLCRNRTSVELSQAICNTVPTIPFI